MLLLLKCGLRYTQYALFDLVSYLTKPLPTDWFVWLRLRFAALICRTQCYGPQRPYTRDNGNEPLRPTTFQIYIHLYSPKR